MALHRDTRRPAILALTIVPVVCLGLVIHSSGEGAVADFVGDALYAVMMYLVVAWVGVRVRTPVIGLIALAICAAIEVLQLTGVPAALAVLVPVSQLFFGTGFDPLDLLAYAVGAAVSLILDNAIRKPQAVSRR
jgi:Protein of unknown function (DUF2809)